MRCCGRWKTKFHRKWLKQISAGSLWDAESLAVRDRVIMNDEIATVMPQIDDPVSLGEW
jgi:hypothetical protein